ncbi:hypothetical protein [Alkalihalobacterium alkalinitrilicum]|uniref:hypothetical protein n=1 Tax=Alkalihalobacterium alkalinitrilicum TaxID=427920 RepID=UPI001EE440EE|nr:hypothetical protein [Alkalihalobacterium alkalinitrilicum]
MKLEVERGNERRVQEAATMIKAYCELLTVKDTAAVETTMKIAQENYSLPSKAVTTTSTVTSSAKDEGSLLDF